MSVKLNFRNGFWIAAALLMAVLLALAFRPRAIAVDLGEVARGDLRVTVRDEGRTRVRNEFVVSAPVGGRLLRVDLKPGAHVHAGQTVARILPGAPAFLDAREQAAAQAAVAAAQAALAAARAALEQAEATATFARAEAERVSRLRSLDLIAVDAYDRARRELGVAEGALGTARETVHVREAELDTARVRLMQPAGGAGGAAATVVDVPAPVAGRVLRVAQESESVIAAGAEVMLLGDPNDLEIVVELLSTDAVQVVPGAAVYVENWSGGGVPPLRGTVRLVEPYGFLKISALGVEEQRVNVIVDFAGPPEEWASLGHGFRVEAAIVTWEEADVLQVPIAALFRSGDAWAAFRVADGRARLTPVEIGRNNGRAAQVLTGIDTGDAVVLYPGEELADGARVQRR